MPGNLERIPTRDDGGREIQKHRKLSRASYLEHPPALPPPSFHPPRSLLCVRVDVRSINQSQNDVNRLMSRFNYFYFLLIIFLMISFDGGVDCLDSSAPLLSLMVLFLPRPRRLPSRLGSREFAQLSRLQSWPPVDFAAAFSHLLSNFFALCFALFSFLLLLNI